MNHPKVLLALCAVALPAITQTQPAPTETVVAFPWVFKGGNETSQGTALKTVDEIVTKAKYEQVSTADAEAAWASNDLEEPKFGKIPTVTALTTFGKAVHASKVVYGSVSWHTRSIWVTAGPKTISTATVDAYILDVNTGKLVYKKTGVTGRSDEKENKYKLAADVLLTPLVSAVSGGPATPREQRAVQIALGLAFHNWVRQASSAK